MTHRGSGENAVLVPWKTYSCVNGLSVFQECVLPLAGLLLGYLGSVRKHGYLKCTSEGEMKLTKKKKKQNRPTREGPC